MESKNHHEGIIEKIEDKSKEVGEEIKEVVKGVVEEEVVKVEKGIKKVVDKIEGKKEIKEKKTEEEKTKKGSESKDSESAAEITEHKKEEAIEKRHSRHHPVKEKAVKALAEKIKNSKTLMVVSIKGLPSRQFQSIKKSIREHANVQVAKKNIMTKAIKAIGDKSILDLEKDIQENSAFVTSDLEGYELAGILAQKKTPAAAKAGQESPVEIEVKAGPTDLVPGPAISELGSVGLKIAVEEGKLSIKEDKVIVNEGQTIDANTASILQKLNILPFSVGLEPVALYDVKTGKIYRDIKIDSEEAAENLRSASGKALGFAQKIVYYCKETIGYLLGKANAEGDKLESLAPAEKTETNTGNANESKAEQTEQSDKSDIDKKDNTKTQPEIKSEEEK